MNNKVRYPTGRTWLVLPVLTFSLLFITACPRDSGDDEDVEPKAMGLIPASIGNKWIYVDSTWWDDGTIEVVMDTIEITDTAVVNGEVWWELSGPLSWLGPQFMVRQDSIFRIQYVWSKERVTLEFIPPTAHLVEYSIWVGGDQSGTRTVLLHPEPVSVPAGTFYSTGIYITDWGDGYYHETIIAPDFGIIKETAVKDTVVHQPGPNKVTLSLVDYDLIVGD